MDYTSVFVVGVAIGLLAAGVVAGGVFMLRTGGDDHPLSIEEIRGRLGEVWHP